LQPLVDKVQGTVGGYVKELPANLESSNLGGINMTIADRIQSLRKTKGLSQEELADAVGVSRQAVSKWESEQATPDLDKVIIMSDVFDVTTDYLLKGIEPIENEDHKTMADVIDNKILTDKNGKRAKTALKWFLIGFGVLLGIDFISMLIYFLVNGFPA